MLTKGHRNVNIGILGCGAIAQAGHLESVTKARNANLFAICDVAEDLAKKCAIAHGAEKTYTSYESMLADPEVDAIIIATADSLHGPASLAALAAGKHVLCEKPISVNLKEAEELMVAVTDSDLKLQIGHMKRFDPGIQSAKDFINTEMGEMLAFKGWYCDSTHRYPMTDAVQPLILKSDAQRRPSKNPKSNPEQYYMLAHGSHLVDMARFLCGDIKGVRARNLKRFGAYSWFVDVDFANGALGHLDLTVAVRMDWHEGFQLYGENGSIIAKTFNPWYFRSSEVDIFRETTGTSSRVLGADAHFFRLQLESFADAILEDKPVTGANIFDGVESVKTMLAIVRSAKSGLPVLLADVNGAV